MIKLPSKSILLILILLVVLSTFGRMLLTGATILFQTKPQLEQFGGEMYAFNLVVISCVRELSPFQAGLSFAVFAPFILLLCTGEKDRLLYGRFFIISLLIIPLSNVLGIMASLIGGYKAAISAGLTSNVIDIAKKFIGVRDFTISFVKSFLFGPVLCIVTYFLSKKLLKKRDLSNKLVFAFICIFLGFIALLVTDSLITGIDYVLSR